MFNFLFRTKNLKTFIKFSKYNFSQEDYLTNDQIKSKIKSKWDLRKSKNKQSFIVKNNPGKVKITKLRIFFKKTICKNCSTNTENSPTREKSADLTLTEKIDGNKGK
jgi:hypothetical protein